MFRVYNKVSYMAKHALIYALCLCMTIGWTQASAQLGGIGKSISGGANTVGQDATNTANTFGQDATNTANTFGQDATNTANTVAQGATNTANTVAQGSENLVNNMFPGQGASTSTQLLGSTAGSTGSTSTPSAADYSMYTIPGLDSSIIAPYLVAGADQSLIILNDVTGTLSNISTLAGRTSPYAYVTQSLVDYFTRGMFSIALILFSYTTIMGTIYTADEGEVMGRKFQTFFVFFRSLMAITLYFPLQSGYSILQSLVSTIVITSVMVANAAWVTVVTIMVTMFSGSLGNSLMPYIGDEDQIIQQATQSAANGVDSTVTAKTTEYLIASGTSELASQAFYMGQLAQMICVYENYDQGNNSGGINNAYNAINNSIFCSGGDCPFSNPNGDITLTLPGPERATNDCGKVKFKVNDESYQSYAGAVIQPVLSQLNGLARMYYQSAVSASNKQVTDSVAQTIANELYSMTSGSLVSMITSYMVQNTNQLPTSQADIIKNLTKGGWAMAANNYFYYAYTYWNNLDTNTQSPNYESYVYIEPTKSQDESFSFCPSASTSSSTNAAISVMNGMCNSLITSGNVGKPTQCATTPTASGCPGASNSAETYSGSMQQCALNINNCKNINQYLIANQEEGGQTVVKPKDFIKVFYKGFSTQISDMDSVKSFAQIEAMTKLCNVPFATSSLNSCEDEGSFLTPETGSALLPGAIAAGVVLSILPRYAWLAILSPFVAFYGGVAWYQNYTDLYDLVSDPTKLYPDTLAFSVQSFTYLTVKAWFDTFDTNRNYLFVFPVQTFSAFGFRVLLQTVAFVFNVGTATFAANISMTFSYFFRQVLIDAAIAVTQYYGKFTYQYGWFWFYANIMPFPPPYLPLIWIDYAELAKNTGIYAPLPIWWWIYIIFIPVPIGLIASLVIIPVGALTLLVSLAGTIAEIFNPAQILLQLNSFIISRYNPLYLAIATPIISFSTLFAFFLPLYPMVVYTLTIITWVTQYIETLLAMPIILLGMANPEGHSPLLGKAEKLIMLLAVLFVRPITIVMGFVAANIIASISVFIFCHVLIPMLDIQIGQWAAGYALMTVSGAGGVTPVFDSGEVTIQAVMTIVALIMFSMVLYYLLLNAFSLIYKLPNGIANWIGLSMMTNAQEEEIMMQLSGEINNVTGSLTEASTSIATTQGDASSAGGGLDPNQSYSQGKSAYKQDMASGEARRESKENAKHNRGES